MHDKQLTVFEYQALVKQLVHERGFDDETVAEVFTLLVEEVGELAKALRKANGQKIDKARKQHNVNEELADVFWYVLDLANRLGIDLAKAFDDKEAANKKRNWTT